MSIRKRIALLFGGWYWFFALPVFGQSLCNDSSQVTIPAEGIEIGYYSNIVQRLFLPKVNFVDNFADKSTAILVGIVRCTSEPLIIYRWDGKIEGIYADYLSVLSRLLKIPIKIRIFDNHQQARNALNEGYIQLLAQTSAALTATVQRKNESKPILIQPLVMLVKKEKAYYKAEELRVLVAHSEPPELLAKIRQSYREVVVVGSAQEALRLILDDKADGFISGQAQIAYQFTFRSLPSSLVWHHVDYSSTLENNFVFRVNDPRMENIDRTLNELYKTIKNVVYERWIAGVVPIMSSENINFSLEEKNWLLQHPVVNVVVKHNAPPYSFENANGQIIGMNIDILRLVGEKTGIHFNLVTVDNSAGIIDYLQQGKAQMALSLVSNEQRQKWLLFSHPYSSFEWVMITGNYRNAPKNFQQLRHRKVVVVSGHILLSEFEHEPDIELIEVNNMDKAIEMVLAGAADAVLDNFVSANYLQSSRYGDSILIHPLNRDFFPARYAVIKDYAPLVNILNKAIDALSPKDLRYFHQKWLSPVTFFTSYSVLHLSSWIILWGSVLSVISITSIFWGSWLTRQIRQRKAAKTALQNSLAYWETLFNTIPAPMFVCDPIMNITAANPWFLHEMGDLPRERIIGHSLFSQGFFQPDDEVEIFTQFLSCLSGAPAYFSDCSISVQGQTREVYLWLEHYRDAEGIVQGIIGGWFDITERKLLSRELRTERDKAKRASNEKSAFLAHISHEIRTALYVIIGILELEVRQLPENVPLHTASRAANSLLGVIGDVLDFTRIESGKVTLNLQSVGLYALLEQCAEPFCAIAQDKGLGFTLELTIPKQNYYLLDATRITQVINNLLSNAVKFTDEGFITFRAAIQRSINSETEMLSLYVQDTGCGIPEHMYSEILQPYVQVEADSRGTGLGLPISIQLMALMDGTLTLEAAPGSGTLAHMYLPLKRSELQEEEVSPTHIIQPEPLNILLVDDLPANLQVLSLQLASSKHRVTIAEGAEQALTLVEENYFDMVLTDCQMPVMNGYELTRVLRTSSAQRNLPPQVILGCTANAFSSELSLCLAAGMDGVLVKPLTQDHLLSEIARYYQLINSQNELCFDGISALASGDRQKEYQLLQAILEGIEQDLATLHNLRSTSIDKEALSLQVHRMKGVFALLCYQPALRVCWRIEKGGFCGDSQTLETLFYYTDIFRAAVNGRLNDNNDLAKESSDHKMILTE